MTHKEFPGPITLLQKAITIYRSHIHKVLPILLISFCAASFQTILTFTTKSAPGAYLLGSLLAFLLIYLSYLALVIVFSDTDTSTVTSNIYHKSWNLLAPYASVVILVFISIALSAFLFFIPAIIVGVFLSFTIYTFVVEGDRGMKALTRSWYYIRGNWWNVFGRIFLFSVMLGIASIIFSVIVSALGLNNIGPRIAIPVSPGQFKEISLVGSIANQIFRSFIATPISIIFFYLLYKALKERKVEVFSDGEHKKISKTIYLVMIGGGIMIIIVGAVLGAFFARALYLFQHVSPTMTAAVFSAF